MHEMSIMESVVDILRRSAAEHGIRRIRRVDLVVGRLTNALPDALQLAFEVLRRDTLFAPDATLAIEERPVRIRCLTCRTEFEAEEGPLSPCPACGGWGGNVLTGEELYVAGFEGD